MCNSELSNQKNQKNHLNMCIRIGIIDFFIRNAHIFANPLMLHETVLARFCSLLNVCIQKPKLPVQKLKKHKKKNIFLIILTCSLAIGGRPTFLSGLAETWFVPSTEKQPLRFHWNLCPQAPFCLEIIMQGPFCLEMKMQGPFCLDMKMQGPFCLEIKMQAPFCLEIIMQGPFCLGMKMQGPFCTRFHGFVNLYDPYEMYT